MLFSVIIATWNRVAETKRLLDQIRPNPEDGTYEVILVDYANNQIIEWGDSVRVISITANPYESRSQATYSHARNVGAAHARGEWLVFLDGDLIPSKSCLLEITKFLAVRAKPNILYGAVRMRLNHAYSTVGMDPEDFSGKVVFGYCQIFHRESFALLNGYNEGYYGWGEEDKEVCERARRAGMKVDFIQTAHFTHPWHESKSWQTEQPVHPNPIKEDGYTVEQITTFEYDREKYLSRIAELESENTELHTQNAGLQAQLDSMTPKIIVGRIPMEEVLAMAQEQTQPVKLSWWQRLVNLFKWGKSVEEKVKPIYDEVKPIYDPVKPIVDGQLTKKQEKK